MVSVEIAPRGDGETSGLAWRAAILAPYVFWVILTLGGLAMRPPTAPVELELLASSWHMYLDGGLVPVSNGVPDPRMAPLMAWATSLSWHVLGETQIWPRLLTSFCGLATLILIGRTANLLWPHRAATPIFSRLLLMGLAGFAVTLTMIQPELLALPFILLVFHAQARIWLIRPAPAEIWWARLSRKTVAESRRCSKRRSR